MHCAAGRPDMTEQSWPPQGHPREPLSHRVPAGEEPCASPARPLTQPRPSPQNATNPTPCSTGGHTAAGDYRRPQLQWPLPGLRDPLSGGPAAPGAAPGAAPAAAPGAAPAAAAPPSELGPEGGRENAIWSHPGKTAAHPLFLCELQISKFFTRGGWSRYDFTGYDVALVVVPCPIAHPKCPTSLWL